MPGMFPFGFAVEIQDVASGEWIELGDLTQSTRFVIEDAPSVVDASGRIAVRVVGGEIDPSFGQMPIFIGAAVEGRLP
jgi:hypothetical protein